MEVSSLEICGFRRYETLTAFDFRDKENDFIFDADEASKLFLLDAILGIIFGFDSAEKEKFRGDENINKTFTGVVTLELDERTMMIERDFETNFVACLLSDVKTTRSIFQGKDFVGNGYSRPYLQMLKSIFPITDKKLVREICEQDAKAADKNFSHLLDSLYIIFTPQFKFSSTKFLINESRRLIDEYQNFSMTAHAAERLYLQKKTLKHLFELQQSIDRLSEDYDKLKQMIRRLRRRYEKQQEQSPVDNKYASLQSFNPLQARADILMWKSLVQKKMQHELELQHILERKERITRIMDHDLHEYNKLPDSFSKDITRLKDIYTQLDNQKDSLKSQRNSIKFLENKLTKHNMLKRILLSFLPPLVFVISYFSFGPFWILIIPESLFAFFLVFFIYGHSNDKLRTKIYRIQEETHIIEKRIHDYTRDVENTQTRYPLLQEKEYIESHLERFRKFQQFQTELRRLQKEENAIRKVIQSTAFRRQLAGFENKYNGAIDIMRPDLETFLDAYVEQQGKMKVKRKSAKTFPLVEELSSLQHIYIRNIDELKGIWRELSSVISEVNEDKENDITEALNQVDRKFKNLHFENRISFSA